MRKKTQDKAEDSFLTRWSEKKSQADNAAVPVQSNPSQDNVPDQKTQIHQDAEIEQPLESDEDKPVLVDADMPDIETLDHNSDFSGFLSPGVSDELRKLALRKLFRSKIFNVRDGLDDYDDDFRSFAALGDIITSDMKHQMELAEEREKQRQQEQDEIEGQADTNEDEKGDSDEVDDQDHYAGAEPISETEDENKADENSEFAAGQEQAQDKS